MAADYLTITSKTVKVFFLPAEWERVLQIQKDIGEESPNDAIKELIVCGWDIIPFLSRINKQNLDADRIKTILYLSKNTWTRARKQIEMYSDILHERVGISQYLRALVHADYAAEGKDWVMHPTGGRSAGIDKM